MDTHTDLQLPRLSIAAAERIAKMRAEEGKPELMLRLRVDGGGCSGFQYHFDFADNAKAGDTQIETKGVIMLVDEHSLPFLQGAEVDYINELIGSSFRVINPNATASCGCGSSFSVF